MLRIKRALTTEEFAKEQGTLGIENEIAAISLTLDRFYDDIQELYESTVSKNKLLQDEVLDALEEQTENLVAIAHTLDKQNKTAKATEKKIKDYFGKIYLQELRSDMQQSRDMHRLKRSTYYMHKEISNKTEIALDLTIVLTSLAILNFIENIANEPYPIVPLMLSIFSASDAKHIRNRRSIHYRKRIYAVTLLC